jgi:hypothetical protein
MSYYKPGSLAQISDEALAICHGALSDEAAARQREADTWAARVSELAAEMERRLREPTP